MEIVFIPVRFKKSFDKSFLEEILKNLLEFKKICVFTNFQFSRNLIEVRDFLEKNGKKVVLPKGKAGEGAILGCEFSPIRDVAEEVDAFLYLGSGEFHAFVAGLLSQKPIIIANPITHEVKVFRIKEVERIKRKIKGFKAEFIKAEKVGIIASKKVGQNKIELALELKKKIERVGKKAYVFLFDEVVPEELINFDVDFWINTACPRIAIDDIDRFDKPVLNYEDIGELLNEK